MSSKPRNLRFWTFENLGWVIPSGKVIILSASLA